MTQKKVINSKNNLHVTLLFYACDLSFPQIMNKQTMLKTQLNSLNFFVPEKYT